MKKHFVTFLSPGTFVAEETTKEIGAWNTNQAVEMAKDIKERYGATPYGFYFTTRKRCEKDFDSKQTGKSHMYYLGGKIVSLGQLKEKNDSKDAMLIRNMESNGHDKVIINNNSWGWTQPFKDGDVVLKVIE